MKKIMLLAILFLVQTAMAAEVDLKASTFGWTGTKVTGKHHGQISLKSASVKEDKGKIVGGEFVIDMSTITNADIEDAGYKKKFLTHMSSDDFFDVAKYPTAKLVVKEVKADQIVGDLTIKDKTNPVTVAYKAEGKTYSGTMKFDRTKFNMVYGSGNFFKNLGDKMIHDEVTLDFKVVLK